MKTYSKHNLYAIILIFLSIISCTKNENNDKKVVVARAGDNYLYMSDLADHLPKRIDAADSLTFAHEYIKKWVKEELLLQEAEQKLSNSQQEIKKELEDYRRKLLIYKYKSIYFQNSNFAEISYADIENYYNRNPSQFILKDHIIRLNYIIMPNEVEMPSDIKRILESNDPDDIGELEEYFFQHALKYDNFNDRWIYFAKFLNSIDYQTDNDIKKILNNSPIEFTKGNNKHIIAIKQFKTPGDLMPIDMAEPQIKNLLINKRKLDFLREIKDSLYNSGLKYNNFRVYK